MNEELRMPEVNNGRSRPLTLGQIGAKGRRVEEIKERAFDEMASILTW